MLDAQFSGYMVSYLPYSDSSVKTWIMYGILIMNVGDKREISEIAGSKGAQCRGTMSAQIISHTDRTLRGSVRTCCKSTAWFIFMQQLV